MIQYQHKHLLQYWHRTTYHWYRNILHVFMGSNPSSFFQYVISNIFSSVV